MEPVITVPTIGFGAKGAGQSLMNKRSLKLVWTSLVALGLLSGCGVKGLPVGPTTKKVPPVISDRQNMNRSDDTAARLRPDSLTASSRNLSITGAEVSRNDVPRKSFILDPLLN